MGFWAKLFGGQSGEYEKDADFYYSSGIELAEKGHIDEAIKAYRKAIEINPQHADAYAYLGALLYNAENCTDEAIKAYREALRINPHHAKASSDLEWILGKGAAMRKQIDVRTESLRAWRDDKSRPWNREK